MGGCFASYAIPSTPRRFTGDIQKDQQNKNQQKKILREKSVSSKKYQGTNTFEDTEGQNQPIGGDIYLHFKRTNDLRSRTEPQRYGLNPNTVKLKMSEFQKDSNGVSMNNATKIKYISNPYATNNDQHKRSQTDCNLYNKLNKQYGNNYSMPQNENFKKKPAANQSQGILSKISEEQCQQPLPIRLTQSKYI